MREFAGGVAIAGALVFLALSGRYELSSSSDESGGGVFRIDRLSGEVTRCVYSAQDAVGRLRLVCGEVPGYAIKPVSSASSAPSLFEVRHPEAHAKQEAERKRLLAETDAIIAKQAVNVGNNDQR